MREGEEGDGQGDGQMDCVPLDCGRTRARSTVTIRLHAQDGELVRKCRLKCVLGGGEYHDQHWTRMPRSQSA